MTITLRPEQEEMIAKAIESGAYRNTDEVIDRALTMLRFEDEWVPEDKDEMNEKIERAFAQFERGEFFTAEELRVDMEKRKAEWLANRKP